MFATEEAKPSEKARCQQSVLVLEYGATAYGTGLGIERIIDEIHPARMRVVGLIRQPDRDGVLDIAGGRPRSGRCKAQIAQEIRLAAIEDEVNGIDRHDHCQERRTSLATGYEIASIDAAIGDAASDRCAPLRPFEVELRLLQRSFGRSDLAGRVALGRFPGIEFALGERLAAHERCRPLYV